MIDEPRVEAVHDNNEKEQWGKRFFFTRDGRKSSLDTRKSIYLLAGVFGLFATIQLLDPRSAGSDVSDSNISAPSPINAPASIDIASIKDSPPPARSTKRSGTPIKYTGPKLVARPRELGNIPPGSMVNAVLASGASNGPVRAELSEALTVNGVTVIESGAVLVGEGTSSEERLFVVFKQVVFRDGTFGTIAAQACDASDRIAGLKGSKIGNKALNIAGSIGLGFVAGMSQGLQDTRGEGGAVVTKPSMKNALLNGTATAAMEQSQDLMSDLKNRKPIIEVSAGTPICVIFGGGQ
jgi:type IV secretory pathway VirB10-like protein